MGEVLFHPVALTPWISQADGRGDGWGKHMNFFLETIHGDTSASRNKIRRASFAGYVWSIIFVWIRLKVTSDLNVHDKISH